MGINVYIILTHIMLDACADGAMSVFPRISQNFFSAILLAIARKMLQKGFVKFFQRTHDECYDNNVSKF